MAEIEYHIFLAEIEYHIFLAEIEYHIFLTFSHLILSFNDPLEKPSENILGKGENAGNQHFSPFLTMFLEVSFLGVFKSEKMINTILPVLPRRSSSLLFQGFGPCAIRLPSKVYPLHPLHLVPHLYNRFCWTHALQLQ